MTPSQIADSIYDGIARLEEAKAFGELAAFSTRFPNALGLVLAPITRGQPQDHNKASTAVGEIVASAKQLDSRSLYQDFLQITTSDVLKFSSLPQFERLVALLQGSLDELLRCYDAFLKTHGGTEAVMFLLAARDYVRTVATAKATIAPATVRGNTAPVQANGARIDFAIESTETVTDLADRLSALATLYSSCCRITGDDSESTPLTVVLIENGSVRLVAEGAERAIGLASQLLALSHSFLRRTFTTNGRLEVVVERAELGKKLLEFRKLADDEGIDTSSLGNALETLTTDVGDSLQRIVGSSGSFEINRVKVEIPGDQKALPPPKPMRFLS